jgi:ribosome-binding protein aMBF1 (putative translation factor)
MVMGRIFSGWKQLGRMCLWLTMATAPISPAAEEFGARVRARRQELGKSQEQLAEASGLHWTFVGQVERGRRNLSLANILKLAAGLDIDPADLVRGLRPEGP